MNIRKHLYTNEPQLNVVFNPLEAVEVEKPYVVDLTIDIGATAKTQTLKNADYIVVDNEQFAYVVRKTLPTVKVAVLPFGYCEARPINPDDALKYAILNCDAQTQLNNAVQKRMLRAVCKDTVALVYGESLEGIECEVIEDFNEFAARADILILPSLDKSLNSISLPLAVMLAETTVLCNLDRGYYSLSMSAGVFPVYKRTAKAWKRILSLLERDIHKLRAAQRLGKSFARQKSDESIAALSRLAHLLK
ncbi:MAG: hypothetical protein GY869_15215 [Planctomycetes bacterium]|nr:hypothetical protein [Planctomycetota bacterium]